MAQLSGRICGFLPGSGWMGRAVHGQWLDGPGCAGHPNDCADLVGGDGVNGYDFALLAADWYKGVVSLQINEFMAINDTTIADGDGEYADWIEIFNASGDTVDLAGWYLTDNPSNLRKWRFPSGLPLLGPGQYRVVFASDEDVDDYVDPAGYVHTNFRLEGGGEYLALVKPDGQTTAWQCEPRYPEQFADMSYGLGSDALLRYFDSPTPGFANNAGNAGVVLFSHTGGLFINNFSLELTSDYPNTVIRYTTDGNSLPTASSTLYTNPIPINSSTWIRVKAFEPGRSSGPVMSHSYLKLAPDVNSFSSNMPIVVVDSFGYDIDSESGSEEYRPWYPFRPVYSVFIDTAGDGRADINDVHDFAGRAGMKVRGNSSQILPKKQYRLETWDENDEDKNVSILDFPSEADWAFHAPYGDKALMRNYLAYKWGNELGRYATRTRFCEMFFNWQDNIVDMSDYQGVYLFMEKVKRDKNRVDITRLEPTDNNEPEISGGYIMKVDVVDEDETGFQTSHGNPPYWNWNAFIHVYPDGNDITGAQETWIRDYIEDFEDALYGPNFDDPVTGYPAYIDTNSFMDYHFLSEVLMNADSFYASVYMHKDRGGKMNMGPIWDWNVSMGGTSDWGCDYAWSWDYGDPGDWGWLCDVVDTFWFPELSGDPDYRQLWVDRWAELRLGLLATGSLLTEVDATAAYLNEAQARNFARWPVLGQWISGATQLNPDGYAQRDTYQKEVDYLKDWLVDRLAWVESHFLPLPQLSHEGGQVPGGFSLTMTKPPEATKVYYTQDGADPRAAGGAIAAGAQEYTGPVTLTENAVVKARSWNGSWQKYFGGSSSPVPLPWSGPKEAVFVVTPATLVITEIMYHPEETGDPNDPNAEFIELKNVSSGTLDLGGFQFTDGVYYTFPGGPEQNDVNLIGHDHTWKYEQSCEEPAGGWEQLAYNDDSWSSGNALLYAENAALPGPWVKNTPLTLGCRTYYFRTHFQMDANPAVDDVALTMYTLIDDGAVVYLNGVEVQRIGMPGGAIGYDTLAGRTVDDAVTEGPFSIPIGSLVQGDNVLAVEVHQKNPGSNDIVFGLTLDAIITTTQSGISLAPDEYVLVVKDQAVFKSQYSPGPNDIIAGEYTGRLDDGGENIRLHDALGITLLEFGYGDNWYPITDGEGYSLTIIDPCNPNLTSWNLKESWRPSTVAAGSPGGDDGGT
ncbi:MAG: CotH kinase family protein, partial [Planctomycetota bacterium]